MSLPLDYETLRVIWWLLIGVLLIGFAIMDGFDLGVAFLLPILSKTDVERRTIINTIGPTWEGNQVWFILGGGAIFAAWPALYALSFSGFYLAMLVVLLALILRPVGFKYRSKLTNPTWRSVWDIALFIGGTVPAIIFGVAVGNVLQGVPYHFTDDLMPIYTGTFLGLLNPFGLLCGVLSLSMLAMHGASFLNIKVEGVLQQRAKVTLKIASITTMILFALAGLCIFFFVYGYSIDGVINTSGPSNPLHKSVIAATHPAWLSNYQSNCWTLIVPALAFLGAFGGLFFAKNSPLKGFVSTAISLLGIIATVGVSMFPFMLPSSSVPSHSLIVWDASSSHLTLFIMFVATVIFMPIVLSYTSWVYKKLSGKVTAEQIEQNSHDMY